MARGTRSGRPRSTTPIALSECSTRITAGILWTGSGKRGNDKKGRWSSTKGSAARGLCLGANLDVSPMLCRIMRVLCKIHVPWSSFDQETRMVEPQTQESSRRRRRDTGQEDHMSLPGRPRHTTHPVTNLDTKTTRHRLVDRPITATPHTARLLVRDIRNPDIQHMSRSPISMVGLRLALVTPMAMTPRTDTE